MDSGPDLPLTLVQWLNLPGLYNGLAVVTVILCYEVEYWVCLVTEMVRDPPNT